MFKLDQTLKPFVELLLLRYLERNLILFDLFKSDLTHPFYFAHVIKFSNNSYAVELGKEIEKKILSFV